MEYSSSRRECGIRAAPGPCVAAPIAKIAARGGDFHQQRIVKRRDHAARVAHAAVEPNAESAARPVGQNVPVIGREFVLRIFSGDAALHGVAVARDLRPAAADRLRPCSERPCATRICARTRSIPVITSVTVCSTWMRGFISMKNHSLRIQIEQKFDRARVVVTDFARDLDRGVAQVPGALVRRGPPTGRSPPLSGAAAARSNRARADEGRCHAGRPASAPRCAWRAGCIFPGTRPDCQRRGPLRRGLHPADAPDRRFVHHAHAASAAAKRRLDDERKPNFLGDFQRFGPVFNRFFRSRQSRHAHFLASARAAILSPITRSNSGRGPTKVIPASSQARAKSAFSERNP